MPGMAKMRESIQQLDKVREGEKRADQVKLDSEEGMFKVVSEEEHRAIVEARRDTFIVGNDGDRSYDDTGKELWEDAASRERRREEKPAAKATVRKPHVTPTSPAPSSNVALSKAFGAGARSLGEAAVAVAPGGAEQKDLDDMLAKMCGEVEAAAAGDAATAGPKRRRVGKKTHAGSAPFLASPASEPAATAVKKEPKVKLEPRDEDIAPEEPAQIPLTLAGASLCAEMSRDEDAHASGVGVAQVVTATVKEEPAAAPLKQEPHTNVKDEPADEEAPFDESVLDVGMSEKRKREEAEAKGMRSWLEHGVCPGVKAAPAAESGTVSAVEVAAPALQQVLEEDGALWFYFVDAVEEDRSSRVYLFGKIKAQGADHQSCCLVVEKIERCLHLLLNVTDPDDEEAVTAATERAKLEFQSTCQKRWPGFTLLRSKVKRRNYAFEKPLPNGDGNLAFLKVLYDAPPGQAPLDLTSDSISHVFGSSTSLLERILLSRHIMGPGWLRLQPGTFAESQARLSTCAVELRGTPSTIQAPKTAAERASLAELGMPSASPALRVMSLSMQTVQRSAQHGHEPVCIVCTLHPRVNPDGTDTEAQLKKGMTPWAAIRRLDGRPLPRDAETALPKGGVQCCSSEAMLLNNFLAKVQEFDPDVLIGYSAYGFDLDVLGARLAANKIQAWSKLGRLRRKGERQPRGAEGRQGGGFWVGGHLSAGRLVCDTLLQARELLKLTSYDLPNLVKEQLGDQLSEIEPEDLLGYYESPRKLLELAERTFQQSFSLTRLAHSLQVLPLTKQLTNLAGNIWNGSLQNKRAERNEILLCHEFHRQKFVLPDKETALSKKRRANADGGLSMASGLDDPEDGHADGPVAPASRRGKAAYTGGLVLEPKAGLYDDYVLMLDFNSLYPSIIQEHNICFSTVDRPNEREVATIVNEADLLAKTKLPDGTEEEGVLPQVLRKLVQSRREVKAAMKSQKDKKRLQTLEIRQKALKLTANSMYGTLGFQNSRFYTKPLAAMITCKGREALQSTISIVQQELSLDVVYGDTDSIFVNSNTSDYDQAMQAAQQIKRSVNKRYKRLEIEIDGVFGRLLLLKKKKYAAIKVIDWKKRLFEREVKGLDMVRRDWCLLAKDMGEVVLKQLLESADGKEASVHNIHDFVTAKRAEIDARKLPTELFVITKAVTKAPKDYPDAKNQPHVQVALRMQARGRSVLAGQEIEYVICEQADGASSKASVAERAYHPQELNLDNKLRIDIEWYKEHQLHPVLSRMLSCVDGTDAGRIAECLGMDGSRFARRDAEASRDASLSYIDAASADVTAALDRSKRWKGTTSSMPGVPCPKCAKVIVWEALLRPEKGETLAALFCCDACGAEVNPCVARNMLALQLRQLLRAHAEGWSGGGDDGLDARTRRRKCGVNEISERKLHEELERIEYYCEAPGDVSDATDLRGCREAVQGMGFLSQRVLSTSGRNWVDCGEIFGGIFGKKL